MHWEDRKERNQRYTCKMYTKEFGDALGGHKQSRLEYLEAVDQRGGEMGDETQLIG